LLACHRLGRLVGRGATLLEVLVGIAIDRIATNGDLAYLDQSKLTAKQVQAHLKDLQGLLPLPQLADKIEFAERFRFLDALQLFRHGGPNALSIRAERADPSWVSAGRPGRQKPDAKTLQALERIDWEVALRNGNQWYDRMAAALRLEDRTGREKELDKIGKDLRALRKDVEGLGPLATLVLGKDNAGKTVGKAVSDVLIGMMLPSTRKVQNAADRAEQVQRDLYVAFALAAYRLDTGRYPAKLEELAPKYLAEVPGDLFSGQALVYRPAENGYLFYSVGVNGKDDGGRQADDDPPGDDVRVRMPLPDLNPKK
jgi:hypothetical protein